MQLTIPLDTAARTLRSLARDQRGAAIAEFALILMPMLIMIMGGMDLAYQAYAQSALQGALNDVARTSSIEGPSFTCEGASLEAKVGCALRARSDIVARHATYSIMIKSYQDFSGVGNSELLVTDYNSNGRYDPGDCFADLNENGVFDQQAGKTGIGGADDVVFYEVSASVPRLLPLPGLSANHLIRAETALRSQPYARQKVPPTVCV